ncbi:Beta-peptidyl aminopeptidase BapA [Dyadobacter sp. CECT 9275]|uniref:Beta-peptidyl aminopeptidase BapA n=1 Tax=Dyadobacter helix TaxID=2822344 RepID=A0A916JF71_9BACT|nr:P1 family peptidase [Dyadobacter sp. CECT 9275]CAG5009167.1 Beta-peptidyl aminopeptidase BapA [Dyadobacter sp. CECT 9275]
MKVLSILLLSSLPYLVMAQQRPREAGIKIGVLPTGAGNAITDVEGVRVGQITLYEGADVRTGVTAILQHGGNIFQQKVPAAVYVGNGFGKLTGSTQIEELGTMETPIVLTNTLSVPTAADGLIDWTLGQGGNENVRSVNAVVGETNDGTLNDIRGRYIKKEHVLNALAQASDGKVEEGNVGAGTGTVCFGWKGGIGTSSRKLPQNLGGYTVGVLVQSNFGGVLQVDGVPVGEVLGKYAFKDNLDKSAAGSCMIVVATDAPLDARNLKRLAKRAMLGLGKTGGIAENGSGDYVLAFSTVNRVLHETQQATSGATLLHNDYVSPLFMAVIEATEEAIINSLFMAKTSTGFNGSKVEELPEDQVLQIMKKYGRLN